MFCSYLLVNGNLIFFNCYLKLVANSRKRLDLMLKRIRHRDFQVFEIVVLVTGCASQC